MFASLIRLYLVFSKTRSQHLSQYCSSLMEAGGYKGVIFPKRHGSCGICTRILSLQSSVSSTVLLQSINSRCGSKILGTSSRLCSCQTTPHFRTSVFNSISRKYFWQAPPLVRESVPCFLRCVATRGFQYQVSFSMFLRCATTVTSLPNTRRKDRSAPTDRLSRHTALVQWPWFGTLPNHPKHRDLIQWHLRCLVTYQVSHDI